ncbi:dTDP-4-dehydrorhamnose 3,5-epimerase [Leptospira bandrabouensis]|uniref:dTDP-4-dehydrorhamnose 3,5-epimerase n=1 Tax=Leptospira bandrabouensis TaxID=2484903 RepID=UPI001EE93537|nr:dTDP-4-dehydrorhamnose 3,5-epimerase [Leptospira bandrabouensis]MCG6144911.1 dTDP-4-dehydrorhamnose 3,5-epimerase [Leptospira bandrabouensis]MCG6152926.1 dTDP-4-dehydrorhamnose 3,5-epimerase [Leptospira bandrabouensis]MCG6160452.1 dTDP-4-dehydrorhamnose 3,5-epimerase [Leptospira bandrabouensis]MCG6164384.1 dTDP-4-dehydrorhamnose 3,5-epimerase [Leptospira bandrabouensis]MCW7460377.1 dTDP-4-dehydrorhamnose 3,5-epimerase [Leptospira bandrabouensis]
MDVKTFAIEGPLLLVPSVLTDSRGYFLESYKASRFASLGIPSIFNQDNQSRSAKGVVRGLHFQSPPMDQGKLVRVIRGSVLDVAVDIRKKSPTYGKFVKALLTEQNKHIFWIPPGFAHGFLALENDTDFLYKVTNEYSKEHEGGLRFDDVDLGIDWEMDIHQMNVSEKDLLLPTLKDFSSPF